jgi:PmbA protein
MNLEDTAQRIIRGALDAGATAAECTISEGDQFSVNVRMGEIETLTEAGSRGAGLRILVGKNTGSAYTSDLSDAGIQRMISCAVELATITTEDPYAGLPEPCELGRIEGDLGLFSPDVARLSTEWKIEQAKAAEAAALEFDKRITNSEGASFDTHVGYTVFANSLGFLDGYRSSHCSVAAVPVARDGDSMERDYWFSVARSADRLEKPADIGRRAAERALRRLNARKVATQKVPVILEPRIARTLVDNIFEAVSGDAIYRGESFLVDKMGEVVTAKTVTLTDDATTPERLGTSPFDDEGVRSRRTVVIENGVLQSWLLNSYTARKLGLKTTGNASRGLTGNAGVGHGNLCIANGTTDPADLIKSVKNGFYVTELIGFGVNIVTGDYSRGAVGLWIENGELAYAVSEVTVAGSLQDMLMRIEGIGNDLEFRGAIASPTLLIGEMTVSGQ